jgi:tripartite-type tricarboxylate transporter receptor subunit TctC
VAAVSHGTARAIVVAIVGAAFASFATTTHPQQADAGVRPIHLIVPAAAGGSADKVGRLVASQLSAILDRPVVVENHGGGMVAGSNAIAAAKPDGETLGLAISTAMIGARFLVPGARFNPTEDFTWLAILGSYPNAMIIPGRDPARTLDQWLEAKRRSPRALVVGSFGPGSAGHLAGSFLRVEKGVNLVPRFIDTLADGYALLTSGEIDVLFDGVPNAVVELPKSGHRAIAVTSERPVEAFPDLPAFGTVWPGASFEVWLGIVAPKGLPDIVRSRLASAIGVLLLERRHAEGLRAAGLRYRGIGGAAALAFVEDEVLRTARLISRLGEKSTK